MFSVLSVRGARMELPDESQFPARALDRTVDRDDVMVPELVLHERPQQVDVAVRPILDIFWQAAGWPGSRNYKEDGRWHEPGSDEPHFD